jgi:glycosyltransferase involved in cell wall biosynthesis
MALRELARSQDVAVSAGDSHHDPGAACPGVRLKLLLITNMYPDAENPGRGAFVLEQADALRRADVSVDVVYVAGQRSKMNYLAAAAQVFTRTRAGAYDIVHAHYGLSGVPSVFRCRTPLVVTLHGSDALVGRLQPLISRLVCRLADAVIVVSKGIQAKIPGDLIPCGVDLTRFKPRDRAEARAKLGLPLTQPLVLFPFDPARRVKRYELARGAIELLRDIGAECVTVSNVSNDEMPWYYNAADAMILSSVSEGSPTSVKEALACNLPVVSTAVGDVAEILDGVKGCAICEATPESLAGGLRRILTADDVRRFDGRSAMQRYDQQRIAASLIDVYHRVLRSRDGRNRRNFVE